MGHGGRAHSRLVGKHPPGHPIAYRRPGGVPQRRGGVKGPLDDGRKRPRNGLSPDPQHNAPTRQKQEGHQGHQAFAHLSDAPHTAPDHRPTGQRRHQPHHQSGTAPSGLQRGGDRVGLDQIAPRQRRAQTAHTEHRCQTAPPQSLGHVAHGAALEATVTASLPVAHRQRFFRASGHHPQQGRYPHPEHRPRSTQHNGSGHTGDTPGANGGGQGGGQRLRLAQAALSPLPPGEELAHRGPQPDGKAKELEKASAHRVPQPCDEKEPQQPGIPQSIRQTLQCGHTSTSLPPQVCAPVPLHAGNPGPLAA